MAAAQWHCVTPKGTVGGTGRDPPWPALCQEEPASGKSQLVSLRMGHESLALCGRRFLLSAKGADCV